MVLVAIVAQDLWKDQGQELVITSGLDGEYSKGSKHYSGDALDYRTRYPPKDRHESIGKRLQEKFGDEYGVVIHKLISV